MKLQLPASHSDTQQQTRERQQLGEETDRQRKEKQRERNWQSFSSIDGVSHGSRGGELTERNPLKMAKNQEVEHIAKKLDKMVHKKNTDGALDLLRELKNIKMSLETLQSGDVCECGEETQFRKRFRLWPKFSSSPGRNCWVRGDGAEGKPEEKEKKNEDSPVSSFPPPPVTTDSVRNKCRELLVAALQTDGDYKNIGANCGHLAAQIEEDILLISNLKDQKNPDLRRNEMASAELKLMREALTKESIREHQLSKVQIRSADEPMTTFVLCNSCGNRWK
ncbi:hypothetical protein F7725_001069, partial [Dissostichus mawsoni]